MSLFLGIIEEGINYSALYLRNHTRLRNYLFVISFVVLFTTIIFFFAYLPDLNEIGIGVFLVVAYFSFSIFAICTLAFSNTNLKLRDNINEELERLGEERTELKKKVEESIVEDSIKSVSNLMQLNLNQIAEYYTINKSQARNIFRVSVTALIFGSITILIGIYFGFSKGEEFISLVTVSSGIIIEIIAGLYFVIYNKTLKQLNYFFSKLENVQDTMLAIELSNGITNEDKKIELIETIVKKLIERSST